MKIAAFNGGLHEERVFSSYPEIDLVYVGRIDTNRLMLCDVIIIPFHLDQIFLLRLKTFFKAFLRNGGILIMLGATEDSQRAWLPFLQWEKDFTTSLNFDPTSNDGKIIFDGISDSKYLKYHGIYYAHGSLQPGLKTANLIKLAWDNDDRVVMLIRREGIKGTLFATTLDPDFHSATSVPGPSDEKVEHTHRKASHFLSNIINWAKVEVRSISLKIRIKRKVLAFLRLIVLSYAGSYVLYFSPFVILIFLIYRLFTRGPNPAEGMAALLASLGAVGSITSIISFWKSRNAEKKR